MCVLLMMSGSVNNIIHSSGLLLLRRLCDHILIQIILENGLNVDYCSDNYSYLLKPMQALLALRLYKSMARESEQDDLEVDVSSEIMCYAQ